MAIMIPSVPKNFVQASKEGEIFNALTKLSNDYFVFHSFKITNIQNNEWQEKEIDFVIFNEKKGLMCIEAKAGAVHCDQGTWYYANGSEMRDPFEQALSGKWKIYNHILKFKDGYKITSNCKMPSAVWFPSIDINQRAKMPPLLHANQRCILTKEDLNDPTKTIEDIFSIDFRHKENQGFIETNLTKEQVEFLKQNILCPTFNIIPSKTSIVDYANEKFNELIDEQKHLLDYLEEQRSAVINGAAGTGKTMIALEKAKRHSAKGEKVLFLCFNKRLKEYLADAYKYENVSYYTIDGFALKVCRSTDFELLYDYLHDQNNDFGYDHVIIDEGQDFGQTRMEIDYIFSEMEKRVLKKENGTFYVFYDKMQLVQAQKVPAFIESADCRLTLYRNCRNTKEIAETSLKPLKKEPKMFDFCIKSEKPSMRYVDANNITTFVNASIEAALKEGINDIQIISCAADGKSIMENELTSQESRKKYVYKNKEFDFTTCRKFKGLEADKVILVDVDKTSIDADDKLFYVGSSRAKLKLDIMANLTEDECRDLVVNKFEAKVKHNDPKGTLAKLLFCKLV